MAVLISTIQRADDADRDRPLEVAQGAADGNHWLSWL
jgi:hypothetical protein